ncbi:RNA polymerase sigma factor [Cryptosporangium phraense]|uniref:Sigma-70 family RNA polymerase sigma factor n=1 Tax=Cryptosporangium phraense TaxID=2593070 RepID=A0A545AKC2_9ACTN|nr:sigma-70 family RNA polymerase sigma factor [Cryptosporangium phraense]TQS41777.1 sigma-70 family RNA polymerase sigma factor [Cryptosporangium phraense]
MTDTLRAEVRPPARPPAASAGPPPDVDTRRIGHDAAALERFYRAHYDEIVRYFSRRLTDPHDVADLVADTFLAAVESASTFDPRRGRPLPWLIGIAHNRLRRFHRDRTSDHRTMGRIIGRRLLEPDDVADLEARIDAERRGAGAVGLLAALPESQRQVVELVDVHGLTPAEAARVTGVGAGLVYVRLHRGRTALRAALTNSEEHQ